MKLTKRDVVYTIIIEVLLLALFALGLKNYFNHDEINHFIDGAVERGYDYHLEITNKLTVDFSFEATKPE